MTPPRVPSRLLSALGLTAWLSTAFIACAPGYSFDEQPTAEASADSSTTGGTPAAGCGTDTYANYAQAVVSKTCFGASCHNGTVSPDFTMQSSFVSNKTLVANDVTSTKMPLGGTMTDAERARFVAWVNCGAP